MTSDLALDLQSQIEGQMPAQRSLLRNLPTEASCRLRSFWYTCWRNFETISDTTSFDLEFHLERRRSDQRLWLCELLLREPSYGLKTFWYTYCRNFGMIFGIPSFDLEFDHEGPMESDLEGPIPSQRSWLCCRLPRKTSCRFRPSWYACLRNFGTISGTLSLEFDLDTQKPNERSWLCKLARYASCRLRPFWWACRHNLGTISGTSSSFDLVFDI